MSKNGVPMSPDEAIALAKAAKKMRDLGMGYTSIEQHFTQCRKTIKKYVDLYEAGGEFEIKSAIRRAKMARSNAHEARWNKKRVKRDTDSAEFQNCKLWNSVLYG